MRIEHWFYTLPLRLRSLFRRGKVEQELDEELRFHIERKTEEGIAQGLSPKEARYSALRAMEGVEQKKEECRDRRKVNWMNDLLQDLRYALRGFARTPGFAATVIVTLALGIGANAAIFTLLHAVILRTLPVPEAEQLRLFSVIRNNKEDEAIFSYPVLREMQTTVNPNASLAGFSAIMRGRVIVGKSEPERAAVQLVSGTFFEALRVRAQAGRLLNATDDQTSGTYPAVLSDGYWAKRFARDPQIVGRILALNDTPIIIVGISAAGFSGLSPGKQPDYWLPISAQRDVRYQQNYSNNNGDFDKSFLTQPEFRWLGIVARIHDPRTEKRTDTAINQIYVRDMQREVRGRDPAVQRELLQSKVRLDAGSKGLGDLRKQFATPLIVLMSAVGMVLLIACANITSLALARTTARQKEIAVRCSIAPTGPIFCKNLRD